MLQDLRCRTWRLLTLIMRSLTPPPHVLSHEVKPVARTWSENKVRKAIKNTTLNKKELNTVPLSSVVYQAEKYHHVYT